MLTRSGESGFSSFYAAIDLSLEFFDTLFDC